MFSRRRQEEEASSESEDELNGVEETNGGSFPKEEGVEDDSDVNAESDEEENINDIAQRIKGKKLQMLQLPEWQFENTKDSVEPDDMTVTHINQTHDLLRAKHLAAARADEQTSEEWLQNHSVGDMQLTMKDLVTKGKPQRPETNKLTGEVQQHLVFDAKEINEFEYRLHMAIEMYTKRIKWMLNGSKRIFGLLKGKNVAIAVDSSEANCGFGRMQAFQESLIHLIDEQMSQKNKMYLLSFGTESQACWPEPRDINCRILDEAKAYVGNMQASGGCNLLKAMKQIMKIKGIDSILLVLGSVPDQSSDMLCDFIHQMGVGKDMPLQTVAYDCSNHLTNVTLKNLANESRGRYHCYTSTSEEQIYTGSDISLLLKEIKNAQEVINKIKEMRKGMMGSALISIQNEISMEIAKLPSSRFLPRPPGHTDPLKLEHTTKLKAKSSQEWLLNNGLKAKHLDLYQVLSPNAYSYKEEFIPVIRKTVQSQVNEKAMAQFHWADGSVRNVHVDLTQMFEYQKHLGAQVKLYEKRIDWLSSASRRIWGTAVEDNIVILIDLSVCNANYLVHVQHSMRLLMEQQLGNKAYFNIISFGSTARKWQPTMVKATPQNLQAAWRYILELQCTGSRNFMDALRLSVQNEEEQKHNIDVEGIYLFTSGIPDQPEDMTMSFVEEAIAGRGIKLHTVLFNIDDYDKGGALPGRYANITKTAECLRNLAHCSSARFHWFRETGVIESDDIKTIVSEIDKAINFSQKCAILVDSVKKKYEYKHKFYNQYFEEVRALPSSNRALPPSDPKHTALSLARMQIAEKQSDQVPKALMWRPSSAGSSSSKEYMPSPPKVSRPCSAKDPMQRVKISYKKPKEIHNGDRAKTGSIKKYPTVKSVRKGICIARIPDREEILTSKEWLRLYSLSKLKLDLNKLVSGPDCRHTEKTVKTLGKNVTAKYCSIFPSVNIKGTIKHLQLLPHELMAYEEEASKVLKRYLKRLQWLLSGSRRVFGTVIHKKVAILVDTSGSMAPHMEELQKELASLVWEQLYRLQAKFNLIRFSGTCEKWQDYVVDADEMSCHGAIGWISRLVASGNTCTLDALDRAFEDEEVESIYLLTDGKPDHSTSMVLREIGKMNEDRHIPVNTISFNCEDSTANNFLKMLAVETSGRYHRVHKGFDGQLFAHKLLTEGFHDTEYPHLPEFDGDDLRLLGNEIALARKYISDSRTYRTMFPHNQRRPDEALAGKDTMPVKMNGFAMGSGRRPKSAHA